MFTNKLRCNRFEQICSIGKELFGDNFESIKTMYTESCNKMWLMKQQQQILYHDLNHIYAMTINADKIAKYMGKTQVERQMLFIACLYHDINHSFGTQPDSVNVARAIGDLSQSLTYRLFNKAQQTIICDIIFCTVFPFRVIVNNDLERIARIADLTMCFQDDVYEFACGLMAEFDNQGKEVIVTELDMLNFTLSSEYSEEILDLLEKKVI